MYMQYYYNTNTCSTIGYNCHIPLALLYPWIQVSHLHYSLIVVYYRIAHLRWCLNHSDLSRSILVNHSVCLQAIAGFHPVGEAGEASPPKHPAPPPPKKGRGKKEKRIEREGREKWKVCIFLCYDMLDRFKIH